jgi:hypothetical protein
LLLDLQKAVLSPKLLGPPASFEQVQIQAKADAKANVKADPAKAAPRLVRAQSAKPVAQRAAAQKKVARRGNPLERQCGGHAGAGLAVPHRWHLQLAEMLS